MHYTSSIITKITLIARAGITAFATILSLSSPCAQAGPFHAQIGSSGPELIVNGEIAVTVPGTSGPSRADTASSALQRTEAQFVIARATGRKKAVVETSHGTVVLRVTRADAKAFHTTTLRLAIDWAAHIDRLATLPAITIEAKQRPLIIQTGGSRTFSIGGIANPTRISVTDLTPTITTSAFDQSSRTVTVSGLRPGYVTVSIGADDGLGGSAGLTVPILVEDPAGAINAAADVTVTGSPASRYLVLQAVRTAVFRSVSLHSGATLEVVNQPDIPGTLPPGNAAIVPVTVRAAGSDLAPIEQTVDVHVQNDASYTPETAQTLYYSNDPETVKHPQQLFNSSIPSLNHPVRLVFHHQNVSVSKMAIVVEAINTSTTDSVVRIVRGLTPPVDNPVDAGAMAGTEFLREWMANSSEIVTIPAQSRLVILDQKTSPGGVASGIVEMTQISGVEKSVLLDVAAHQYDPLGSSGLNELTQLGDPSVGALALLPLTTYYNSVLTASAASSQIYSNPTVKVSGAYAVGGTWLHLIIGTDNPIPQVDGTEVLLGNYGVIYTITISLSNPTDVRRQIEVGFESGAGDVSGAFCLASGQTTTISDLSPPNEQQITKVVLAPGASQSVEMITTPLSGSAYPAAIVAHAL